MSRHSSSYPVACHISSEPVVTWINQAYILENCLTFSNFVAKFVADGMGKLCAVHLTISQNGHGYGLNAGLNIITCDISGWLW